MTTHPPDMPTVHTKDSAAAFLAISKATLDRLTAAGEIDVVRVGVQVRYTQDALDDYLHRNTTRARANQRPARRATREQGPPRT